MANAMPRRWERRKDKLHDGAHGAIFITVEPISNESLRNVYNLRPVADGVEVRYYGHKDDLAAADCLKFGLGRYDVFNNDGHGGSWVLSSKAAARGNAASSRWIT